MRVAESCRSWRRKNPTNAGGKNPKHPASRRKYRELLHTVGGSTLGPLGNTLGKGCNGLFSIYSNKLIDTLKGAIQMKAKLLHKCEQKNCQIWGKEQIWGNLKRQSINQQSVVLPNHNPFRQIYDMFYFPTRWSISYSLWEDFRGMILVDGQQGGSCCNRRLGVRVPWPTISWWRLHGFCGFVWVMWRESSIN